MWQQIVALASKRSRQLTMTTMLVLGLLAHVGCSVRRENVSGTYELQYKYGVEELQILSDGAYRQTFVGQGQSTPLVNQGRSEFQRDGEAMIVFRDFMLIDGFFGRRRAQPVPSPGLAMLTVL